jgi:hypothetical protein
MNIQNLNPGKYSGFSSLRDRIGNAYERIAAGVDSKNNENNLRIIQAAVVTVSAISTGFTNAYAHRERIGDYAAFGLALLIVVFVERFYFVLRHGLTTTYKAGKQRFYAMVCYRAIQISMILNATILSAWIVGFGVPPWLDWWNHWSIVVHFSLALIGVQAVRDSDSVIENRMLELKAATARQDLVTARKAAAIGSPLALIAAKTRGFFDAIALSFRLLFSRSGFSKKYMQEINQVAAEQYTHIDALPSAQTTQVLPTQRRPGFVNQGDTLD